MTKFLSDRVKKTPPSQVPADRYSFLRLSDAEPDLGVPSANGYILTARTNGLREWKNPSDISGFLGSTGFTGSRGFTGSQGKITTQATTPPTPLFEGEIWFDSESMKTYVYYDSYWVEVGGSEMGTLYVRRGFTTTTGSLSNNASQNINIAGYKSYVLMTVSTSHASWVRFYSDQASRTADETRAIHRPYSRIWRYC